MSSLIRVKLVWNKLLKMVVLFFQRSVLLQRRWAARTRGGSWTTWASTTTSWSGPWQRRARRWRSGGRSSLSWSRYKHPENRYYGFPLFSWVQVSQTERHIQFSIFLMDAFSKESVLNYCLNRLFSSEPGVISTQNRKKWMEVNRYNLWTCIQLVLFMTN